MPVPTPGTPPRLQRRALWAAIHAALLMACALAALPARADDEQERERLARIANEIRNVEAMVQDARQTASSSPAGQVRFRYDWLARDLRMVREGVEQQLDAPRQPRPVPPLRGDYRY